MTARRATPAHGGPRRLAGSLSAAALVLAMAACAAIPTSGPIGTGDVVVDEPGAALPLADDPLPGGSPEAIVGGFLTAAAAGLSDDFVVARKYLTLGAASGWDPSARVLVYPLQASPDVEVRDDGTAVVSVAVQGSVDRSGVYTEAPPDAHEEIILELLRNDGGEWRIAELDDAVLLSASSFGNAYRQVSVYFATPDGARLVPDVRWFPGQRAATSAVRALLAGPSPWLVDAVTTGVPDGTRLSAPGVVVGEDQVAAVDLSAEAASADATQRDLLLAQLRATLERLPGTAVSDVEVTAAGGLPWEPSGQAAPVRDTAPTSGPYVLVGDRLAVLEDRELVPLEDAAPLTGLAARWPAVSPDEQLRVVLDAPRTLLLLPADAGAPVPLLTGTALVAPSIDRFGWVWTADGALDGALVAVLSDGTRADVGADWLAGRTVRSLRVSRDGSRVAVVHAAAGGTDVMVDVAAVVRDETGHPQRLSAERFQVGSALEDVTQVAWVDEATLAVLGSGGTTPAATLHLTPVGGPTRSLPTVDGLSAIAAGLGDRSLFVTDDEGALLSRQGAGWVVAATGVRDPVFPG